MTVAVVDWDAVLQVIWVSLVTGVGLTAAWGFALLGAARAIENGRHGRMPEAAVYAMVGVLGFATVVAAIVFGILVLTGD